MIKYSGWIIILFSLLFSPLVIAQNFTVRPKASASPAATITQFSAATMTIKDPYHFTQPVFLFQKIATTTTVALPMTKIIKMHDRTFDKKVFFRLAAGKDLKSENFANQPIVPDTSQPGIYQPQKQPQLSVRKK